MKHYLFFLTLSLCSCVTIDEELITSLQPIKEAPTYIIPTKYAKVDSTIELSKPQLFRGEKLGGYAIVIITAEGANRLDWVEGERNRCQLKRIMYHSGVCDWTEEHTVKPLVPQEGKRTD